ncbi:MAG: hypothetical protein JXQ67_02815 [Campylobacterales bacterium]|nr:hypothetical protein [Campylobacterales bacterium]
MHTYQIASSVLDGYRNEKLTQERLDFLFAQVDEQLEELATKPDYYATFLERANVPEGIDKILKWILIMSNESICEDYIDEYRKNYREIIPVSDLGDLLVYAVHLKKVKNTPPEGFDYLLEINSAGVEEVDQYAFTNVLLYIQKSKEVEMEF